MKIQSNLVLLLLVVLFFGFKPASPSAKKAKVLIFSLTKGYRHASIKEGIVALTKMGQANGFEIDTTENVLSFTKENLKKYKALIFLNPTGSNIFNEEQKAALQQYIHKGGGYVGIHAASDCNYEWEWYGKLVGGYFESHPKVQEAKLDLVQPKHPLLKGLPQPWLHKDEWYNFKSFNPKVKVLIKVDETSYQGGTMKNDHPISWYHEFEGGRVFYTALGHTKECYSDPIFLQHLWVGLKWAMH